MIICVLKFYRHHYCTSLLEILTGYDMTLAKSTMQILM